MTRSFVSLVLDYLLVWVHVTCSRLYSIRFIIRTPKLLHSRLWRGYHFMIHHNAFKESIQSEQAVDPHALIYGSSPLAVIHDICHHLAIQSSDTFLDLGSGFGHICFDIHTLTGAHTIGIECHPERYLFSHRLASTLGKTESCVFYHQNFLSTPLPQASIIYATLTCFSPEALSLLCQQLSQCAPGTRIVTVTRPLHHPTIQLLKSFHGTFDWGHDTIFSHRIR